MKVIDKQTLQRSRMLVCSLRETRARWSTLTALAVIVAYQLAALPAVTHAFQEEPEQDVTETDPKAAAKQDRGPSLDLDTRTQTQSCTGGPGLT